MNPYERLSQPTKGEKIKAVDGKLVVPDNPIIPFIEGAGTGPDRGPATATAYPAARSGGGPGPPEGRPREAPRHGGTGRLPGSPSASPAGRGSTPPAPAWTRGWLSRSARAPAGVTA